MAEFAQFVSLRGSDTAFEAEGVLFTFDLHDLDERRTVILMFKVSGPPGTQLHISLNAAGGEADVIDFELDSTFTRPRSWHEIVEGHRFQAADNHLIVGDEVTGSLRATVSDIVVLYHANTSLVVA
jgi:hypothetical protein